MLRIIELLTIVLAFSSCCCLSGGGTLVQTDLSALPSMQEGKLRLVCFQLDTITGGNAVWMLDGQKIAKINDKCWFYIDIDSGDHLIGIDGNTMGITIESTSIVITGKSSEVAAVTLNVNNKTLILNQISESAARNMSKTYKMINLE